MSDFLSNFFGREVKKKSKSKSKSNTKMGERVKVKPPPGSIKYKDYYFLDVKRSKTPGKKLDAIFLNSNTGKERRVSFGTVGKLDFVNHKDKKLLEAYDEKHRKKENWKDLMSKGALKKYILWSKPSMEDGVREYKKQLRGRIQKK
jgi:hypothetical protein